PRAVASGNAARGGAEAIVAALPGPAVIVVHGVTAGRRRRTARRRRVGVGRLGWSQRGGRGRRRRCGRVGCGGRRISLRWGVGPPAGRSRAAVERRRRSRRHAAGPAPAAARTRRRSDLVDRVAADPDRRAAGALGGTSPLGRGSVPHQIRQGPDRRTAARLVAEDLATLVVEVVVDVGGERALSAEQSPELAEHGRSLWSRWVGTRTVGPARGRVCAPGHGRSVRLVTQPRAPARAAGTAS